MNNKKIYCTGCGVLLQENNITEEGYTTNIENKLCRRCFRLKNYGEYQMVTKSNEEYITILEAISKTRSLVLYVVDITNLEKDLDNIRRYIKNEIVLVVNKKDALPLSVKDEKIISYIEKQYQEFLDIVVISSRKNYNIDLLLSKIKKYQKTKKVYVVGNTNAGKSTLINNIIKSHSLAIDEITISPLPSTTLDEIEITISDKLTLVDTPGLVDFGNIVNHLDSKTLKKISIKKEIKPKTFQIKVNQCLIIENLVRIDYLEGDKNSFTVYMSNDLKIKKMNATRQDRLQDLAKTEYELKYSEDIVINGLGFIKIVGRGKVAVYVDKNVNTFVRTNLI